MAHPALPLSDPSPERRQAASGAPARPAAPAAAVNAAALLQALRRRWPLALLLGLVAAAAVGAAVWVFLPPPRQSAVAKLYMPVDPEGKLFRHPEWSANFASFQQTQIGLIRSRLVLNAALRNPKVAALPPVKQAFDPVA